MRTNSDHEHPCRQRKFTLSLSLIASLVVCFFTSVPLIGQDQEEVLGTRVTREEIVELRTTVERTSTLDEETRARVVELCEQADGALDLARQASDRAQRHARDRDKVDDTVARLREELAQPQPEPDISASEGESVREIGVRLSRERSLLDVSRTALGEVEALSKDRAAQRDEIVRRIGRIDAEIEAITNELNTVSEGEEHPLLNDALRYSLLARREADSHEVEALRSQLVLLDARGTVIPLHRDKAQRRFEYQARVVDLLEQLDRRKTRLEAQRSLEMVRQQCTEVSERLPDFAEVAAETAQLPRPNVSN